MKSMTLGASINIQYKTGVLVVLLSSMLSGISAALVQKAFTVPKPKNPILFSAEMAVYGIVFLLIKEMCFGAKFTDTFSLKLFHNWTAMTLIPVFTNASF
jgi:hypothetical protein